MMHGSQYMTNSTNLKKMSAAKFFTSSTMKIKKCFVTKLEGAKDALTSYRENKALGHFFICSLCAFTL